MNTPDTSTCRLCRCRIGWLKTPDGKRKPFDLNADGSLGKSHFLTCEPYRKMCEKRDAERRKKRAAEEERVQGRLF